MWDIGDPMLGTGGLYAFGYDPFGGYTFGVTNQGSRDSSFYSLNTILGRDPYETPPYVPPAPNQFVADPEALDTQHASNVAYVAGLYRSLLGREPDQSGLDYWVSRIEQGLNDRASVDFAFRDSIEYKVLHPGSVAPVNVTTTTTAAVTHPASSGNTWLLPLLIVGAVLVFSK